MCGFFRATGKNDPPNTERRLWTLFMIKHQKKEPDFSSFEQQKAPQPQTPQQEQQPPKNPVLQQVRE